MKGAWRFRVKVGSLFADQSRILGTTFLLAMTPSGIMVALLTTVSLTMVGKADCEEKNY